MTEAGFRKLALALPEAVESAHMAHPDFRVGGKIFATLRYPEEGWGMVKLNRDDQEKFIAVAPKVFSPVKGAWGVRGATVVRLSAASQEIARDALAAAWRNVAPKKLLKSLGQ